MKVTFKGIGHIVHLGRQLSMNPNDMDESFMLPQHSNKLFGV